ncbi:MAG: GAF domain-containing protein [Microbacteriaceae bacterium]
MLLDDVTRVVASVLDQVDRDEAVHILSSLVAAGNAVADGATVEESLREVAELGRTLTSARFGAVGVVDNAGKFTTFVHVGMTDSEIAAVGPLPVGKGMFKTVIDEKRPIRIGNLTQHPSSTGMPSAHPTMSSFLGVPIVYGTETLGNLYLTESARGEFRDIDEAVVVALARIAAESIVNSRRPATAAVEKPIDWNPFDGLTDREIEIISLIAEGLSNREIAGRLFLAEKTVKNYVSVILGKLGMQRRTQAALYASEFLPRKQF